MVRWQKQVFIHTRLSSAYLALARLSCILYPTQYIKVFLAFYPCTSCSDKHDAQRRWQLQVLDQETGYTVCSASQRMFCDEMQDWRRWM